MRSHVRVLMLVGVATMAATTAVHRMDGAVGPDAQSTGGRASGPTATDAEARAACAGACHEFPPPDILPRAAWRDALARMMLIRDGLPELADAKYDLPLPPDWQRILRYYESHAPDALPESASWPAITASTVRLTRHALAPPVASDMPAIANVRFLDVDEDEAIEIVASDMRTGEVLRIDPRAERGVTTLAKLRNPAHIEMADLDQDGRRDLLVADLGSLLPADHHNGALYWLRQQRNGRFKATALADGLARLADARVADFDADGDLDIVLAVFGWRLTGQITLLVNQTTDWAAPSFVQKTLDRRTGAIHVPVADLDENGRPDFVALFAQEHESVVAFLNAPTSLEFKAETIYAAPHPNWGSSGIDVIDLDKDNDLDVLLTHGDSFDDLIVKPYHGIMWLENRGNYPFTPHQLAQLPGAHRAEAADLDGDGDLDIVAGAMVSGTAAASKLASLVWLEQTRPGRFEQHTLEFGTPVHATLDVADYDVDGDQDVVVGSFALDEAASTWVDVWENLTAPRRAALPGRQR